MFLSFVIFWLILAVITNFSLGATCLQTFLGMRTRVVQCQPCGAPSAYK